MSAPRVPRRAMLLAAGRGKRMRELTERRPKPLIEVRGRALIDHGLDRLAAAGVELAVVNHCYLGAQIEAHLEHRAAPRILFSPEQELLDTGGGVKRALGHFGDEPLFVLNGDVLWLDGKVTALRRLAATWDDTCMDLLLLLHPTTFALGYEGPGDFIMTPEGVVRRRREREVAPFVFTGVQILHPRIFARTPDGPFSLNLLYDRAIEAGRLAGLRHDGEWFHIGTPEALAEVEDSLHFTTVLSAHR